MKKRGVIIFVLLLMLAHNGSATTDACQLLPNYRWIAADPEFDAVLICGVCYPCREVPDGVCPEDFASPDKRASCINKPDGDCVARVSGTVYSLVDGQQLSGATVTIFPPPSADYLPFVLVTNDDGEYILENISAGRWTLRAEKPEYDTEILEKVLVMGRTNVVDFNLPAGSCNNDCTDSFGRCSAACDGIKACSYENEVAKVLCEDLLPGTEVIVNQTGEFVNKIQCCSGSAELTPEFRPRAVVHGSMQQLVEREIVARMNNDIVKVKVAVWQ